MKKVISFTLVILMLILCTACKVSFGDYIVYADAEKYSVGNASFNANEIKKVEINWVAGKINISVSGDGMLTATEDGEKLDSEERMHYYLNGGTIIIQYCESGYNSKWVSSSKKDLTIMLPEGIDFDVDNVSASIVFSTDILLEDVNISTVSGNVDIKKLTANSFDLENVSGELFAKEIKADRIDCKSVSGDIDIDALYGYEFDAETVSGKVNIGVYDKTDIDINSISGTVNLILSKNIGAEVDFSSVSGNIRSDIPHTQNGETYVFGSDDAKVQIETVSGNLYIK